MFLRVILEIYFDISLQGILGRTNLNVYYDFYTKIDVRLRKTKVLSFFFLLILISEADSIRLNRFFF